jgi:hypothetical protein
VLDRLIKRAREFHQIDIRVNPRTRAAPRIHLNRIKPLAAMASPLRFFWRQGARASTDCCDGQAASAGRIRDPTSEGDLTHERYDGNDSRDASIVREPRTKRPSIGRPGSGLGFL